MDQYIMRETHDEFARRIEDEHKRTNHRLELLEENVRQNGALVTAVEKLASNMEHMAKEQERQGERLDVLENHDGETWRKVSSYIITVLVGAILTFVLMQLGIG